MKILLATVVLAIASVAQTAPLTVRTGESWVFKVRDGQPADAHKVEPTVKPAKGELMVTVRSLFGTVLIITNNSVAYSFNAELIPAANLTAVRTCALPGGGKPDLEQWEQKAQGDPDQQLSSYWERKPLLAKRSSPSAPPSSAMGESARVRTSFGTFSSL